MRQYPTYKSSKFDSLGEIPIGFNIISLKHLVAIKITDGPHETPVAFDDGVPFVSAEAVQNFSINFDSKWGFISMKDHLKYSKKCKPQNGDIFIIKSGATTGKVAYVNTDIEFNIWSPLALVRANEKIIYSRFLFYFIICQKFQEQIQFSWSYGTQQNIGMGVIQNLKIIAPSQDEQKQIIKYLDFKTKLIDDFIANRQKQIDLFKEQKAGIINKAVTFGINSKVKMKPTDLNWLPEIPENFEMFSLKHIVKIKITDGPHLTPKPVDDGIPFISAEAIKDYTINFDSKWGYISLEDHVLFSKKCKPQNGDIFIVKSGATTGKVAYVNTEIEFNIWSPLALIRADERKVFSEYLFYSIISKKFQEQIQFSWSFGTQQNIGMSVIQNLKVFVPPPEIQEDIVQFIKEETSTIEMLISKYQKQIELMQEYRTAIISQAVTGKIDVREWQPKTNYN